MELTATRHREIVRLLDEIDNELRGKCRMLRILNLTRRIRLKSTGPKGMTEPEKQILQAIRDIVFNKETSDKVPAYALSIEVSKVVGMDLRSVEDISESLVRQDLIKKGKSLNYNYYKPISGTEKKR